MWGRKGLFQLSSYNPSLWEAKAQGRNLEAGTEAESMEEAAYWLVPGSHSVAQAHIASNTPTHSGLSPPIAISSQDHARELPHRLFQWRSFLS